MTGDEETGTDRVNAVQRILLRTYAGVLALVGLALAGGGGWLLSLGGSAYYLVAGVLILVAAVLLWRGRRQGAWVYMGVLGFTVVWAVWEAGLDGWSLLPRLFALSVLGAWLILPWTRKALSGPVRSRSGVWAAAVLIGCLLLGLGLHAVAWRAAADPRFQTGFGAFPAQAAASASAQTAGGDWPHVGGDQGAQHYSPLAQITPANVDRLRVAWTAKLGKPIGLEATPVKVGDRLYTCNNTNEVFALDAATGRQIWRVPTAGRHGKVCRGVVDYRVPGAAGPCAERILTGTGDAKLVALDAATGAFCHDFGDHGVVDLLVGLSKAPKGYYRPSSAPMLVRGKVVLGGWVSDNQFWGEPSGVIRAFDAVTGKLAWAWDMGRPDRTTLPPPGETYTPATPNAWAPMSADEQTGTVYVPTGNATPDRYGVFRRPFDDAYSSAVVAIDAETGRERWHFQTKHHDLWDHDIASPPALVDLPMPQGGVRHALIQPTKHGEVYLLDRDTGQPITRVVETSMPQAGKIPEERVSPTQPLSVGLPSFRGPKLREADMWGISPLDELYCRIRFRQARYEGVNTPPGLTPNISSPSAFGALNWGGVSVDPAHGVMVVNSNRFASYARMIPRAEADRRGIRVEGDYSTGNVGADVAMAKTPYAAIIRFWLSPIGVPCIAPPYGFLSAVDLASGKLIWTERFGTAWGSGPFGWKLPLPLAMGAPNHGGSIITSTGLVFIGATKDGDMHAYDLRTGRLLWRTRLPAGGQATPLTYTAGGRQFVVISAGGSSALQSGLSSSLVAFALPAAQQRP